MPEARNCKRCGKVFGYVGGMQICSRCREKDEEDFKRVKTYLYDNPGATVTEIATTLDVSIKVIKHYLKEGRLEISGDDGNLILECEKCGKAIKTGHYCEECQRDITKNFQEAARDIKDDINKRRSTLKYLYMDDEKK